MVTEPKWANVPTGVLCWHIHHSELLGVSTAPLEERVSYIKMVKPRREIELRLKLLAPVQGELPTAVTRAARVYHEAREAFIKVNITIERDIIKKEAEATAYTTFMRTIEAYKAEINTLHEKECLNCPWNGTTIFP